MRTALQVRGSQYGSIINQARKDKAAAAAGAQRMDLQERQFGLQEKQFGLQEQEFEAGQANAGLDRKLIEAKIDQYVANTDAVELDNSVKSAEKMLAESTAWPQEKLADPGVAQGLAAAQALIDRQPKEISHPWTGSGGRRYGLDPYGETVDIGEGEYRKPKKKEYKNVSVGGGQAIAMEVGSPEWNKALATGEATIAGANIQVGSAKGLGGLTKAQRGKRVIAETKRQDNQNVLVGLLKDLQPSMVGVSGVALSEGAGVAAQIPFVGEALVKTLEEVFEGNVEQVTEFRQSAEILGASMVAEITGEESGRITEPERAAAHKAAGVLKTARTVGQVRSQLLNLNSLSVRKSYRYALEQGKTPRFDLTTDEGVDSAGKKIMEMGYTFDEALRFIKQLNRVRGSLEVGF